MFQESIEERYNDLLKQRVTLEGEIVLLRRRAEMDAAKARSKNRRYLLMLCLLPFLMYWYFQKKHIEPLEQKIAIQQDSIKQLKEEIASIKLPKKDSVIYVIKKGDMLVTIGSLFFNDTLAGYQIGIDNGIISEYDQRHLTPGDTLVINYRLPPQYHKIE